MPLDHAHPPTVSVVLIFLDEQRFLNEAIESVRAQTFSDWELLLIDDGSSDGSSHLAAAAAADSPRRIRHLRHPAHENRGCSASRNLGIFAANGRFVAFMDADDVWESDKLQSQLSIFDAHPSLGSVVNASRYWWSWDPRTGRPDEVVTVGAPANRVYQRQELLKRLYPLRRGTAPALSSIIARRDVLVDFGGLPEHIRDTYDDQALLVKLYLATSTYVSDLVLDRYRQHADSQMATTDATAQSVARANFLRWFQAYCQYNQVRAPLIRIPLWWARWTRHPRLTPLRHRVGVLVRRARRQLHRRAT